MAREKLETSAGHPPPLPLEVFADPASAGGEGRVVIPSLGLDVPANPLPGAVGPGLHSLSGEVGEACLP